MFTAAWLAIKSFAGQYIIYIIAGFLVIALLGGFYYKGRSYKAEQIALDNAKELLIIKDKLIAIEKFSNEQATKAKENTEETSKKLETILKVAKDKKVITIVDNQCQLTPEFAKTWNELNGATQ